MQCVFLSRVPTALVLLLAGASLMRPLVAQSGLGPPAVVHVGPVQHHERGPDVPQPPKSVAPLPHHGRDPVPAGTSSLPQPLSPPGREVGGVAPGAPGDLRFWLNQDVGFSIGGGPSGRAPEPSACIAKDTAFMTGNWWAGVSMDSGTTFSSLNPYTLFPAVDAGFCCDQRCIYSPQHDITVWFLQYGYSATTTQGSVRIAVSVGRAGLRAGQWHSAVFSPSNFNQSPRTWLDFPDLAISDDYLYAAANVFNAAGTNVNSVVWRMSLANLRAGGNIVATYFTRTFPGSSTLLGATGSYRFAQGENGTMYFASHVDRANIKLFGWTDAGNTFVATRGVPVWEDGIRQAPSPNGGNWMANHDGRIQTGYRTGTEFGFLWCCEETPPWRVWPFVRVARFRASDMTLIATHDVWNGQHGIGYPGCSTNARGDKGVIMAIGGPVHDVHSVVFMVDQFQPTFDGQVWRAVNSPSLSPTVNRWGDYFTCVRHSGQPNTLVGTGAYATAGASLSRYVWFSRELDEPVWVDVDVRSTPITGIPISVDVADRNGNRNGNSNFQRTYAPQQGYSLTAPTTHPVGSTVYVFEKWVGTFLSPSNVLTVPSCGFNPNFETAAYLPTRRIVIRTNLLTSTVIGASPDDVLGTAGGDASGNGFELHYLPGTNLRLTAPATSGGNAFKRWVIAGSQVVATPILDLLVTADVTATPEYYVHTAGALTAFGTGCPGSTNVPPRHGARGVPEIGRTVSYDLSGALGRTPCWFVLGASNSVFQGLRLPFDMAPLGAARCMVYCGHDLLVGVTADALGDARQNLTLPSDSALVGQHVYSQFYALDVRANQLGMTSSNAMDTRIGGLQ